MQNIPTLCPALYEKLTYIHHARYTVKNFRSTILHFSFMNIKEKFIEFPLTRKNIFEKCRMPSQKNYIIGLFLAVRDWVGLKIRKRVFLY